MFWIIRFILFWIIWLVFADKKRWHEILPVCVFASFLGASTDNVMHHYHMWIYDTMETVLIADLTDDWAVYPVVTYLFIQWLPKDKSFSRMLGYWFIWTCISILLEYTHHITGHISYPSWWNIHWSYVTDWLLFTLFYQYYKTFQFEKLSQ